jgi:hypothetical protein
MEMFDLDLAMHYRDDFLVLNNVRNNENFAMLPTDNTYYGNMEGYRKWEQESDSKLFCYSNTEMISFSKLDIHWVSTC